MGNNPINSFIELIKNKDSFESLSIEEFAPEDKYAYKIAMRIKNRMKINQLRKIFNEVKKIDKRYKGKQNSEPLNDPSIYLLIPQLAYADARNLIDRDFYKLIKSIIGNDKTTKIKTVGDFRRFTQFLTAILAYSK